MALFEDVLNLCGSYSSMDAWHFRKAGYFLLFSPECCIKSDLITVSSHLPGGGSTSNSGNGQGVRKDNFYSISPSFHSLKKALQRFLTCYMTLWLKVTGRTVVWHYTALLFFNFKPLRLLKLSYSLPCQY